MPLDSQRFTAYIELAREHWKSFDHRRQYEWKVNLALWPAFAILIGFGVTKSGDLSIAGRWIFSGAHVLIWLLYVFFWSVNLHARNAYDLAYAEYFKACAGAMLDDELEVASLVVPQRTFTPGNLRLLLTWSPLAQALFTTVLAGASLSVWAFPATVLAT